MDAPFTENPCNAEKGEGVQLEQTVELSAG